MKNLATKLTILNNEDVTDKMRSFFLRIGTVKFEQPYNIMASRGFNKNSNMYFYKNLLKFGSYMCEYKTQSGEEINDYSIIFLN